MKRVLAVFLAILISTAVFSSGASAATAPGRYGDIDWDGEISVIDATLLQRHLIHAADLLYDQLVLSDFDHSGEADIVDAVLIQRAATRITVPDYCGGCADTNILIGRFYASYDSGKAAVGVPVTFTADEVWGSTADEEWGYKEVTFEYLIDGAVVQPRSVKNTLTYTFDEAREYIVTVRAYNGYSFRNEWGMQYKVVDEYSYDELQIISAPKPNMSSCERVFEAQAIGGTAGYYYSFTLTGLNFADANAFIVYSAYYGDGGWQLVQNDDGICLYRDFSEDNTAAFNTEMLDHSSYSYKYHLSDPLTIRIRAMDSTGALSEPVGYVYENEVLIG